MVTIRRRSLPAGHVLVLKQWYDNTEGNPNVEDPDQWVDGGSRTADEMSHAWIAVTHLDEEGYEELLAEREANEERQDHGRLRGSAYPLLRSSMN